MKLFVRKSVTPARVIPNQRDADRDGFAGNRERTHGAPSMHPHVKVATITAAVFVIAASAASAGASTIRGWRAPPRCTWGASSVTAAYENGQLVVSKPATSGCTSRP
jgi:hypothetical protein